MRLLLANHSSYPRVGDSSESQRVRRAYARRETGDLSDEGYLEVVRDYTEEILGEQASAGLDLVTDGQVRWYDCVSHLAAPLDGVRIGGLHRFFDTNYLVRQPEITGEVKGRFGLVDDFIWATTLSPKPVKPVVTGPYTLARHSIVHTDAYDLASLTMAYADVLAEELRGLGEAAATIVQVEEPSLLEFPDDAPLVRRALERAFESKGRLPVSLVTYFGDATPLYRTLLDMPAEMIGLDVTYGPGLWDEIAATGSPKPLALGAVDGRNTKPDPLSVADLVARVVDVLQARGVEEAHLQPSCGLEYLPRDRALMKLQRMAEIAARVTGVRT